MEQKLATTAGSVQRRNISGLGDEFSGKDDSLLAELFFTAKEDRKGFLEADVISRLVEKIDDLTHEVSRLKIGEQVRRQKLLRFLNTTESESGSEHEVDFRPKRKRPKSCKRESWEKDLPRLNKVLKTKEMDPKDEKNYEDVVEEWEVRCRGCGMEEEVLKHLLLHLGSSSVTLAVKSLNFARLSWQELKDEVARSLFPFSNYVRALEKEMEKVDRTQPISAAVVQLTRRSERHKALCQRWQRKNTFYDDCLKEALLLKLPKNKISACLSIPDFNTISFTQFVRHCQMILAAATAEEPSVEARTERVPSSTTPTTEVAAVEVAALTPSSSSSARTIAADQKCPNCGVHGHYSRDCPHPRIKCDVCGRAGHRKEVCFKAQKGAPNGKMRTSYLRMTRSGIHIDLIDEATKKSLFEAMRRHLEGQEAQYAKAKARAAAKRAEKKSDRQRNLGGESGSDLADEEETLATTDVQAMALPEVSEVSSAGMVEPGEGGNPKYVDVEVYQQKVPGLLDNGAVVSLLPETVWEEIPLKERDLLATTKVGSQPISGLGGRLEVKKIADVPIAVAGRGLLQRFFVSPAAGTIILGIDALKGLGLRMDFQTGQVLFNGEHQPIPESAMIDVSPLCLSLVKTPSEGTLMKRGKGCTDEEARKATELMK